MKFIYAILLTIILFFSACQKEEKQLLLGCCDTKVVCEGIGNGVVFIPNIFTPNGDGLNDHFLIFGDSIKQIVKLEIRNKNKKVVFLSANTQANDQLSGWDGTSNGEVIQGVYSFLSEIESADGAIIICEGKVCNFPCGLNPSGSLFSPHNCRFPAQWIYRDSWGDVDYSDSPECE